MRATAWSALTSATPEAAIARFFASDYAFAVSRSTQARARNVDFARRVAETHTAEFAPQVNAAARRAIAGSDADRELFARSGYTSAQERDRLVREEDGRQAAAIVAADLSFVTALSTADPGLQVRGAAAWAVRAGSTDADIVEFFAHGWAHAAALYLDVHRISLADRNVAWRATAQRLVADAEAAERAALSAGAEAATQARQAAARAWRSATESTTDPQGAWSDAQAIARAQADNWRSIAAAALSAAGPNWSAAAATASAAEQEWAADELSALDQARHWSDLYHEASAGERRMS